VFEFIDNEPDVLRKYAAEVLPRIPPLKRDNYARDLLHLLETFEFEDDPDGETPQLTQREIDRRDGRDRLKLDVAVAGGNRVLLEWIFSRRMTISPASPPPRHNSWDKETPNQLVSCLKESNSHSARNYIDALVAKGSESLPALLKAIETENSTTVRRACRALGLIGDPVAVPGLMVVCDQFDRSDVRLNAVRALGQIGHHVSRACIVKFLSGGDPAVRVTAIRALSKIGARCGFKVDDIEQLEKLKKDPEAEVAIHALGALKSHGFADFEVTDLFMRRWDEALELANNSYNSFQAANALNVVSKFDRESALKIALRRVYSSDRVLREEMVDFLEDVDFVVDGHNHEDPIDWKLYMIERLAPLAEEGDIKRLRTFLFSREYQVRLEVLCQAAMRDLTPDRVGLFDLAETYDPNPALKAAAQHLKEFGKDSPYLKATQADNA
jgi:hypothetical protein